MSLKFLRRASGRALLVAAMSAGMTAAVAGAVSTSASAATAATGNNWYVATTGSNTNNNCSAKATPCKTIAYALREQAAEAVGGTLHIAAGTYASQIVVGPSNDGVTLKGAGATTIIEPSTLTSDTDTDSTEPQFAVIDIGEGTSGFNVEKLTVSGAGLSSFLDNDGDGCGQDPIGIYYHGSSGQVTKVSISQIDMPADLFGCQGGQGIYVNSDSNDTATVDMSAVSLTTTSFTTVTKADLPAGSYSNDILPVKAEPAGWNGGEVLVNSYEVSATPDGPKNLFITGTTGTDSPKGSVVSYNAVTPAYNKNGITCDDNWTSCTITGSTIQGEGPNDQIAQNGIQGWGAASITIGGPTAADRNTISGNSWTGGGGSGNAAAGLLLANNGSVLVQNNAVSANDVNIYAGEIQAYTPVYTPAGTWTINDNAVSGATSDGESAGEGGYGEGIQLDGTTNNVQVTDNQISGSAQGGILLTGVSNAAIGGSGANVGNVVTGNGADAGIIVGGPSTECEVADGNNCIPEPPGNADQFSSTNNTIEENSTTGNGIGLIVEGTYDISLIGPSDPYAGYSNLIENNVWDENLGANVADFSGEGSSAPLNSYSGNTTTGSAACNPAEGGSLSLDGLTGVVAQDVTTTSGSPTITAPGTTGETFAGVSAGEGVIDAAGAIAAGTTVQTATSDTSVTLSANALASVPGQDAVGFGNYWAC